MVPGRASAVGMGLQTPRGCMDQPCLRAASAAEASSRVPAAELVHTGTSGPRPRVSAKVVVGPGMGVQVRSEAVSALQHVVPAPAGGCFGGRGTFWGGGSGSMLGGLGRAQPYVGCPWLVPVGPPAPLSTESSGSVVMKP